VEGLFVLSFAEIISENPAYTGSGKLKNKVANVTGGDSGIGPDLRKEDACRYVVETTVKTFGKLDVLVNHHGIQIHQNSILDITREQLANVFQTNILSFFDMTKAALAYLSAGSSIINTTSDTAFSGASPMIDYTAMKGAVVSFTRSLSLSLSNRGIRVNAVAPGPIWTPLIPSAFTAEEVKTFGTEVPMRRPGTVRTGACVRAAGFRRCLLHIAPNLFTDRPFLRRCDESCFHAPLKSGFFIKR
jgi:NAD(P)-dependent dehydrogenase (short-subunit alcohol dehydrogenase family)